MDKYTRLAEKFKNREKIIGTRIFKMRIAIEDIKKRSIAVFEKAGLLELNFQKAYGREFYELFNCQTNKICEGAFGKSKIQDIRNRQNGRLS